MPDESFKNEVRNVNGKSKRKINNVLFTEITS
jgi:hypothetical protein